MVGDVLKRLAWALMDFTAGLGQGSAQ